MQKLKFSYPATEQPARRSHVGVVGSGDCEVLLQPGDAGSTSVSVRTSVDGFDAVWRRVLDSFFARYPIAGKVEINDFGATPAVVTLRLRQAREAARDA